MSAAAAKSSPANTSMFVRAARGIVAVVRHRWFAASLLLAALGGGSYAIWQTVAPHIADDPMYKLSADAITITPRPDWIRADVRGEALRDGSLDGPMSILDPQLTSRIAKAFELHPWIEQVVAVRKFSPARVEVELVYRKPVCMVEVPGGLYAVDKHGVLLPSTDFTPTDAARYPRLGGVALATESLVGTRWEDGRVQGAAHIAANLADAWTELQLVRIVASSDHIPMYELQTTRGTRVIWGFAPGEDAHEPSPADKIAALREHLAKRDTIPVQDAIELDLRHTRSASTPSTPKR